MLFDVQGLVPLTVLVRRGEIYPGWLFRRDVDEWKLVKGKSPLLWQAYDAGRAKTLSGTRCPVSIPPDAG